MTCQTSNTCTINVTFTPKYAGPRYGAVVVKDFNSGDILGTAYIYGVGTGPQAAFNAPLPPSLPTLGNGSSSPVSVAVDGAGNVYVVDGFSLEKFPATCTTEMNNTQPCVTTIPTAPIT
ncbi:MAG: hypothetical protein FWD64_05200 [Acidobacteriaceae bacterium]|nr:hypothetical protein [Acidobacteriaceae bacterium]